MQAFAINGGALNGSPEVGIEAATATLRLSAAGAGMRGAVLSGAAPVVARSDLTLSMLAKLAGDAPVHMYADGVLTNGLVLSGSAEIQLEASGYGLRWVMIQGVTPTALALDGDIQVVPSISATFALVLSASLDLHAAEGRSIEGTLPVVVSAGFDAKVAQSSRLSGVMPVQLASIGTGKLVMTAPPGVAYIQFASSGSARLGAKLPLEGSADIGLYARGYLNSWHYVYAGAEFKVGILAKAEKHGTPNIPGYYVEAPAIRALRVGEEARRFTVPAERRV